MHPLAALSLALPLLPFSTAQETLLGAYLFHRHGDRTPKSLPPASLTTLGYAQVHASGQYYRSRYLTPAATHPIAGLSPAIASQRQLSASAPLDAVLQNSAAGFLQGLYPPVGGAVSGQLLRNGSTVQAPLDGYQLVPVQLVSTGSGSEDDTWLQAASGCGRAETSSNGYFYSAAYAAAVDSTRGFYGALEPVVNRTFNGSYMSFKNAYAIYDLIHVASIHNTSIQSPALITPPTLHQLQTRADKHEFALAYNASDPIRAIAGMTLAGQILAFFAQAATDGASAQLLNVQFGAYASFLSLFGLADLTAADPGFYGIPDYASSMAFELFTNASTNTNTTNTTGGVYPVNADSLNVRFVFHNGTASASSPPVAYPLFGGGAAAATAMPYREFVEKMGRFAVGDTQQWCAACGNTTGVCAAYASSPASSPSASGSGSTGANGAGMSLAVAGVIGAMVTLAVVLGAEALVLVAGGMRVVRKRAAGKGTDTAVDVTVSGKA